ncbi:DUF6270 domain-containing protein [Aestuariivirga sp.]|uniref:DUF6270 domain-containing protein n=1 Tax=Aestuariivirga sp. TaxID=2650926 RepID=UPI003919F5CC
MKKIAILGTCASEDWFHFQDPRRRLDVRLAPPYQQSALVSLNCKPVPLPGDLGPKIREGEMQKLRADFDKSFLATLKDVKPDVLIVDLLLDSRRGVYRFGDSWVTNSYIIHRSALKERLDSRDLFDPVRDPARYLEAFTASVRYLAAFLHDNLPDCRVILHKARWAEYYVDTKGDLHPFEPKRQLSHFVGNIRAKMLETVFEREINCECVAVDDVPVIADVQHIWGFLPAHYQRDYYQSFSEKLRRIIE